MTANEIIIESRELLIKAIREGFEPVEINFSIGDPKGITRGFNIAEVCSKEEITQTKEFIIAGIQREIVQLKAIKK